MYVVYCGLCKPKKFKSGQRAYAEVNRYLRPYYKRAETMGQQVFMSLSLKDNNCKYRDSLRRVLATVQSV